MRAAFALVALALPVLLSGCGQAPLTEDCNATDSCAPIEAAPGLVTTPAHPEPVRADFAAEQADWALVRVLPGRDRIRVAVYGGGCSYLHRGEAREVDGVIEVKTFLARPTTSMPCPAVVDVGPHDIRLPRALADGEDIAGACVPPPPSPTRGISMCEAMLQYVPEDKR